MAAAKTLFSSVYVIGTICFDEWFLFYVITGRHYFSWKIKLSQVISRFSVSSEIADILAHVYVKNVSRKKAKEMKENKNLSTKD